MSPSAQLRNRANESSADGVRPMEAIQQRPLRCSLLSFEYADFVHLAYSVAALSPRCHLDFFEVWSEIEMVSPGRAALDREDLWH